MFWGGNFSQFCGLNVKKPEKEPKIKNKTP
jgi:hypothetical protein